MLKITLESIFDIFDFKIKYIFNKKILFWKLIILRSVKRINLYQWMNSFLEDHLIAWEMERAHWLARRIIGEMNDECEYLAQVQPMR